MSQKQEKPDAQLEYIKLMMAEMAGLSVPGDDPNEPSKFTVGHWIYAVSKLYTDEEHKNINKEKVGKWCIFATEQEIDKTWNIVKAAVEEGKLWHLAKCSSALQAVQHKRVYLICVYTPDYSNEENVMKVRSTLYELGFTDQLKYKRDIDTKDHSKYESEDEFYYVA